MSSYTETTRIDSILVFADGTVQVREVCDVRRDDLVISSSLFRYSFGRGDVAYQSRLGDKWPVVTAAWSAFSA